MIVNKTKKPDKSAPSGAASIKVLSFKNDPAITVMTDIKKETIIAHFTDSEYLLATEGLKNTKDRGNKNTI